MGSLADFDGFLKEREKIAGDAEGRLMTLQSKFETFFAEVTAVREKELEQLGAIIAQGPAKLPAWLAKALEMARTEVERELDEELRALSAERDARAKEAEAVRQKSMAAEKAVHEKNVGLDAQEEKLKARSEALLGEIEKHNARIRALGTGFGFFTNFFDMRRLRNQSQVLEKEQADVARRIEQIRAAWVDREGDWSKEETAFQKQWVDLRTKVSAVQTKLDALEESRPALVFRTVLTRVLYERQPKEAAANEGDPKCPRCKSANPAERHFCQICGQRLLPDRPDLEGSLEEIAEANFHHARFSEGMQKCQQTIGLVRGFKSGVSAFRKSVQSMMDSQSRYPLPKLKLDVPSDCVHYGRNLEALRDAADPKLSLHPKAFGERMAAVAKPFSEEQVQAWFERLGATLSTAAKAQWG